MSEPTTENPPASTAPAFGFLLALDAEYFPAVTLGQGYPAERNGKKCQYFWKESLRPGKFQDVRGLSWEFQPKDIDAIVQDVNRAAQLAGHEPSLDERHPTRDNPARGKNYGWVRGARKNEKGRLELLHQFVGKDETNEALNKKTSILLLQDRQDQLGNKYRWWIDQNAIVSNPQLRDLDPEFKPALAASNGDSVDAIQLFLADEATTLDASKTQGPIMLDITILRAALGEKAKDQPDDKVIALSAEALTTTTTALSEVNGKLKDQTDANSALLSTLKDAEKARDEALALSAEPQDEPDPQVLALSAKLVEKDIQIGLMEKKITAKQATYLRERIKASPALVLSADVASGKTPIDDMIEFAALSAGDIPPNSPLIRGTPVKPKPALTLSDDPNAGKTAEDVTPERRKELLEKAGCAAA